VKTFFLIHRHTPAECSISYAAWNGFDSPLRGRTVQSTCARHEVGDPARGLGHEVFLSDRARDADSAMAQLPPYVRERTRAREVTEVMIG
jgi:hypothetical protein